MVPNFWSIFNFHKNIPILLQNSVLIRFFFNFKKSHFGPFLPIFQVFSFLLQFLAYTKAQGNDLSTPHPPSFPGLKPGDRWALCAARWYEAFRAGKAPLVKLEATNIKALNFIPLEALEQFDDRQVANPNP